MSEAERDALLHLVGVAMGCTGQSAKVANLLLAWWNAAECGGFDLTDLWGVDDAVAEDALTVMRLIVRGRAYPDTLGYGRQFEAMVKLWRG